MKHLPMLIALPTLLLFGTGGVSASDPQDVSALRHQAQSLLQNGEEQEALAILKHLVLIPGNEGVTGDLNRTVGLLRGEGRLHEADAVLEGAVAANGDQWRLLFNAANTYSLLPHLGVLDNGVFLRQPKEEAEGIQVNSYERDRARAIQLLSRAMALVSFETGETLPTGYYRRFAEILSGNVATGEAWHLQYLTDLQNLPAYEPGWKSSFQNTIRRAPVKSDGTPLFYTTPPSFSEARNDGERMNWLLSKAVEGAPGLAEEIQFRRAALLHQQLGVHTLPTPEHYELQTLRDGESAALLASGISRFKLPDESNYISILSRVARSLGSRWAAGAQRLLADIYKNRRQFDKAAQILSRMHRVGKSGRDRISSELSQIISNWGEFGPAPVSSAGRRASVEYLFRNGHHVTFTAREIDVKTLLNDMIEYYRSQVDSSNPPPVDLSNVDARYFLEGGEKYLGRIVSRWEIDLVPAGGHSDRILPIQTPLERAGTYLLTARMEGGNESAVVVQLIDTVIVRKRLNEKYYLFVADAESGASLPGLTLNFFGFAYGSHDGPGTGGKPDRALTTSFQATTSEKGLAIPSQEHFNDNYRWIITAANGDGRFAYLAFPEPVIRINMGISTTYRQWKEYGITDRPLYRPGDLVKFHVWQRYVAFSGDDKGPYPEQTVNMVVSSRGRSAIFQADLQTDEFGGASGEFAIPDNAPAGEYSVYFGRGAAASFTIMDPESSRLTANVENSPVTTEAGGKADFIVAVRDRSGSPVSDATVRYSVRCLEYRSDLIPSKSWDWLYGRGHGWTTHDHPWLEGRERWETERPSPFWLNADQPLLPPAVENETRTAADGRAEISLDTSRIGSGTCGTDRQYILSAEITKDSMERTYARGEVYAVRRPFMVHVSADRGFYAAGDPVQAELKARTHGGMPVRGRGVLTLSRMVTNQGTLRESTERQWVIGTNEKGNASIEFKAAEAGQYRLSYRVTDESDRSVEGGAVILVTGPAFDGAALRFNTLELNADRRYYAPGETAQLLICTDQPDSTVVLSLRPVKGIHSDISILKPEGKCAAVDVNVTGEDFPSFFAEAFTVNGGKIHTQVIEILVPPRDRTLDVRLHLLPGADGRARLALVATDLKGKPVTGSALLSVYDSSLGTYLDAVFPRDIRSFFWGWRRNYRDKSASNLDRNYVSTPYPGQEPMKGIGHFGDWALGDDGRLQSHHWGGDAGTEGSVQDWNDSLEAIIALKQDALERLRRLAPLPGGEAGGSLLWHSFQTSSSGVTEIEVPLPDGPGVWNARVWIMGYGTAVGEASLELRSGLKRPEVEP